MARASRAMPPGAGLSVILVREGRSGRSATSSRSGKLVHGGLRYLEYYEFRLVREALIEREVLLGHRRRTSSGRCVSSCRISPDDLRPAWLVRLGLFLYDHLGGRKRLPADQARSTSRTDARGGSRSRKPSSAKSFRIFRLLGRRRPPRRASMRSTPPSMGARVFTRTACTRAIAAERERRPLARHGRECSRRAGAASGQRFGRSALVNAAGPWVNEHRQPRAPRQTIPPAQRPPRQGLATSSCPNSGRARQRLHLIQNSRQAGHFHQPVPERSSP